MSNTRDIDVLIYVGGPTEPSVWEALPRHVIESAHRTARHIVAVDSGLHLAQPIEATVGRPVSVVIGDLDSVSRDALVQAKSQGSEIITFPQAKDETDFELALLHADHFTASSSRGDSRANTRPKVMCVSPSFGRVDHLIALTHVLTSPRYKHLCLSTWFAHAKAHVLHAGQELVINNVLVGGQLISVLPYHGAAQVSISGTKWQLDQEWLQPGSSRGMSNIATRATLEVSVQGGTALVLLPALENDRKTAAAGE